MTKPRKRKALTNEEIDRLFEFIGYEPPKEIGVCIKTISHDELGKLEVKLHCEAVGIEKKGLVV